MTITEFITKWRRVELTERGAAQQHFLDLCALVGHPTPAEFDPTGEEFCFERGASKNTGSDGWADVWKRGFFGWEYKGKHGDLDKAYRQLLLYRESLENPPLLVVSDMDRIIVRTNFTNTPVVTYHLGLEDLTDTPAFETLVSVFFAPDRLRPDRTIQRITEDAAERITDIARALRQRGEAPQAVARFLDRIVFSLFAEDVGLLPEHLFKRVVQKAAGNPTRFAKLLRDLFAAMAEGGDFGMDSIRHFNGNLFAEVDVLTLTPDEVEQVERVASLDWSGIDPSIFGTLFERALDPSKREQLGAHYTSREDIEAVVDPVIMVPLLAEWDAVRAEVEQDLHPKGKKKPDDKKANAALHDFLQRLGQVTVLDPACGSGNFLYVALLKLKDLEKQVILYAMEQGFPAFLPHVGPWQLRGIEVNPYAHELAQMTVWIGWLQWTQANRFGEPQEPILQALKTVECKDAVVALQAESATEPGWPKAEFIVSNPPFLGDKMMRSALGDEYVDRLRALYDGRVPGGADLCCYWFEKARAEIAAGRCRRAGLLATQGIRGGRNREVLARIKETGDIFFAVRDRDWVLDGANVHVSMVGFDDGSEPGHMLDGVAVDSINANLTARCDTTRARRLQRQADCSFIGTQKNGAFDVPFDVAYAWLHRPGNPNGRPNSDVLFPWSNGQDLTQRSSDRWIIDFGVSMPETQAARYQAPFEQVERDVKPDRLKNRRAAYRERWWLHAEPRPALRDAIRGRLRFLVTPTLSKHRVFLWLCAPTLPDKQLVVFARDDDYTFGVLHSRVHEVWARAMGTQLREVESGFRYTPSSTFETFPFPEPTARLREAVAQAAQALDRDRSRWLNPPEWVRENVLVFPASADGPWAGVVTDPNAGGIGTARYMRLVPVDASATEQVKTRTLTNLYNAKPAWLTNAHRALDEAVFAAYGWSPSMTDDQLLAKLLDLNLAAAERDG
jgi:type II restriction/modification system DNA methylase subunit YeeA